MNSPASSIEQLEQIVADLLEDARRQGASAAEASVSTSAGLSVSVRLGEVETIEHTRDQGLGISVYFGARKGSASTTDLSPAAVREAVSKACTIARHTSEDLCTGLAPAELMAREIPELDLYHPWPLDTRQAIDQALEMEQAGRDFDPRISNSEGAQLYSREGAFIYGNSHGFVGGYPTTSHTLSCVMLADDGDGMQRDYWYDVQRDWNKLASGAHIGQKAAQRVLARLGARKLASTQAPVIFRAEVARSLLRNLQQAISGHAQYRESSFLLGARGQRIFPDWVRIHENPLLPGGLASAPFDNQGVATQARDFIREGRLLDYVLDAYSACKLKLQTTGNAGGVRNLAIEPGQRDFQQLLTEMGTGLVVTELMGQGANPVTGDYSCGAAGLWVENGQIQYPVDEITVAGNLRDMYRQLVDVATDEDCPGSIRTGSWLIENMTIAGQ